MTLSLTYYVNEILHYTKHAVNKSNLQLIFKKYKIHVLIWALFIADEMIAVYMTTNRLGHFSNYLVHYSLNIFLFYFNANIVLPNALRSKSTVYWLTPVLVASEIMAYLMLGYLGDYLNSLYLNLSALKELSFDKVFVSGGIWRGIYFLGFSTGYYYIKTYLKVNEANQNLQKEALENLNREKQNELEILIIRNAYLQAQINPHFLNSALNFIYLNTIKSDPVVADCIFLLSNVTRYAINAEQSGLNVKFGEEISQVINLIRLWKTLKKDKIYVDFDFDQRSLNIDFIPLVLLTLVENVFKHGDLGVKKSPAKITVSLAEGILQIKSENLISKSTTNTGVNAGLKNIAERLTYTYGGSVTIDFHQSKIDHFTVQILLDLKKVPIGSLIEVKNKMVA
jgi:two-component system LytT family sensor kinase